MSRTESPDRTVKIPQLDPRKADAGYKGFPSSEEWCKCVVDTVRWDRYSALLQQHADVTVDTLRKAREVVKRAAAIDTGAIEGLYEVDRGFTFTIATEAALWEAALENKGDKVRALFEAQLHAYDYVLDLATQAVPIAEAWIRELHKEICKSQQTYLAHTEIGLQDLALPLGEYKVLPNHVVTKDGKVHSYSPVDLTPAEMFKLCEEFRKPTFLSAHPVLQASYAHYAFVCIHPFADGNGRVARALASVFTYRSHSIPLMVLAENRSQYISALESADAGQYQPFVDFVLERTLDGIRLVDESLRAGNMPSVPSALDVIKRLYVTSGGYSHAEVDEAGLMLLELFKTEIERQIGKMSNKELIHPKVVEGASGGKLKNQSNRLPLRGIKGVSLNMSTDIPAQAEVSWRFELEVPKDCGRDDDLVLANHETSDVFEARMSELVPSPSAALQMRISIVVERLISELVDHLARAATAALKAKGY